MAKNTKFHPEIKIDEDSPIPVMFQLYRSIIDSFHAQRVVPGAKMPSERSVSDTFGINRYTVHSVYQQLEYEGWLEFPAGKRGAFISLKARKKYMPAAPCIGIVLPFSFSDFMKKSGYMSIDYFKGIVDGAGENDFSTMIINLPAPDADAEIVRHWLEGIVSQVTGIVYFGDRGIRDDSPLESLMRYDAFPQFCVSAKSSISNVRSVRASIKQGVLDAFDLLKRNKHRKVGFINVEQANRSPYISSIEDRIGGIMDLATKNGLETRDEWVIRNSSNLTEEMARVIALPDSPTAFFAHNDQIAMKTVDVIQNMNLKVPHDISIIGYDDDPIFNTDSEFLTTIRHPRYDISRRCAELIDNFFHRDIVPSVIEPIPTTLVVRKSVGKNL